jgi:uncharacterized protein
MSEQDVQIIRDAYGDFNSGNPDGVLERLAAECEWVEPGGGNAPSGTFTTPQSVGEDVFATIPQNFDEFSAEPDDFDDQGERIVVTGRFKGKAKSGADLDAPFEHVYQVEGGKITRLENKVDQDAWTAAWS